MPIKARRGYRSIAVHIPTAQYETLEKIAAENFRTLEQQASAMLTDDIQGMEERALDAAVKRGDGGDGGDGKLTVDIEEGEDAVTLTPREESVE
jgi:hypothetical protein